MTRTLVVVACALALAGCGRKKADDPGNRAASATFTYGSPGTASATQASALEATVAESSAFVASPSASGGAEFSDPGVLTAALLGASGFDVASTGAAAPFGTLAVGAARPGTALYGAGFDDPGCVTETATGVTLTGCTMTVDVTSGGSTSHAVVTTSGSIAWAPSTGTLTWDFDVDSSASMTGSGGAMTMTGSVHIGGFLTLTATTLVGELGTELLVTVSANGQSARIGVDESVAIAVTYADAATCATRVVAGTIEAKRVWTARPQGVDATELPDAAARVTWNGCGTATIAYGTR